MLAADPMEYFDKETGCELDESLLLRFVYHRRENFLDLVIDYAADTVSRAFKLQAQGSDAVIEPRDLRHFRLAEVSSIKLERERPDSEFDWQQYEKQLLAQPQVLTGVTQSRTQDGFQLSFFLGRYGKHEVRYKSLMVETRLADSRAAGANQWRYFDHTTGEKIEFFNPFPWIDSECKHPSPAVQQSAGSAGMLGRLQTPSSQATSESD